MRLPAADEAGLEEYFSHPETGRSLVEYLTRFEITLSVMQEASALSRIAFELAEDAAAENVRWLEVRFSPVLHRDRGLSLHESVEAVRDGLRRAEAVVGVRSGILICALRHLDPLVSEELAELCVDYKNRGVVGFDLAGPEENFPAKRHRAAFKVVRRPQREPDDPRRGGLGGRLDPSGASTTAGRTASGTARTCTRTATCWTT